MKEQVFQNKKIILFDGNSNLAFKALKHIAAHDKKDIFRFASLKSKTAEKLLHERGKKAEEVGSVILIDPGTAYYEKSEAIFEISKELSGVTGYFSWFAVLPQAFSDSVYEYIARNRYKWHGNRTKTDDLDPEIEKKLLD